MNYMLNDSEATNSIGLRNKYAHANGPVEDPNSPEMQRDYLAMLALLISITLKINEELVDATGKGGLDPEGLVDWPLYDVSVYRTAEAAGMTGGRRIDAVNDCFVDFSEVAALG